jgi:hypothetical protein
MVWSLLALGIVGFPFWSGSSSSGAVNLAFGTGYLVIVLVVLVLHIVALKAVSSYSPSTHVSRKLALIMGSMFLIAFLTGFTIGLYILPSAILLLAATILSIRANQT